MTNPNFDDEDEKPLDPAVANVERRVRRLILIAGLTLGLGIFAVFAAILYRIVTYDTTAAIETAAPQAAAEDEAAVRAALAAWNADFNAGNTERICDLFAPDLRYNYRGVPERSYDEMCTQLKRVLSDRTNNLAYALDVKEVIVSGDLAIVRLVWTLSMRPADGGPGVTLTETGMDLFRRQGDGSWRISRFIAYDE